MTAEQARAIAALQRVTFPVASGPKRFARDMGCVSGDHELSPRQDKYLWWVTYRFRRQIRDREIVEYAAAHMVPLDQLPPCKPRKRKVRAAVVAACGECSGTGEIVSGSGQEPTQEALPL